MPLSRVAKVFKLLLRALPVPVGLVAAAVVVGSSEAAFSGHSSDGGSSWQAGTLSIGNSSSDSIDGDVLFRDRKIYPGYREARCVTVTTGSDVDTHVKMYSVDVTQSPVSDAMKIRIDKGELDDASGSLSCDTFRGSRELYDGSLSDFGRRAKGFDDGLSVDPEGDHLRRGGKAAYRITIDLPQYVDNSIAGAKAGATFKWEAQNPHTKR
jgi:hypothetical protein